MSENPWDEVERIGKEVGWRSFEDKLVRKLRTGWSPSATDVKETREEFVERLRKEIEEERYSESSGE